MLTRVMDEESARLATSATAALRGMLGDIQREHDTTGRLCSRSWHFLITSCVSPAVPGDMTRLEIASPTRKRTQLMRQPVLNWSVGAMYISSYLTLNTL